MEYGVRNGHMALVLLITMVAALVMGGRSKGKAISLVAELQLASLKRPPSTRVYGEFPVVDRFLRHSAENGSVTLVRRD